MNSGHVILAGDSIFDNANYVPGEPCVADQLGKRLDGRFSVNLIAVDGDYVSDVWRQACSIPERATHVVVSAGGNDALLHAHKLRNDHLTSVDLFKEWSDIQAEFRRDYQQMLDAFLTFRLHTAICTVYDAVPTVSAIEVTALSLFNDVITAEAIARGLPIVDLRRVCVDPGDYSPISPIEPSCRGGEKIAAAIEKMLELHNFSDGRTSIYM